MTSLDIGIDQRGNSPDSLGTARDAAEDGWFCNGLLTGSQTETVETDTASATLQLFWVTRWLWFITFQPRYSHERRKKGRFTKITWHHAEIIDINSGVSNGMWVTVLLCDSSVSITQGPLEFEGKQRHRVARWIIAQWPHSGIHLLFIKPSRITACGVFAGKVKISI